MCLGFAEEFDVLWTAAEGVLSDLFRLEKAVASHAGVVLGDMMVGR